LTVFEKVSIDLNHLFDFLDDIKLRCVAYIVTTDFMLIYLEVG